MRGRTVALALLLVGCGRVSFDPTLSTDSAASTCLASYVFCDDFDRTSVLGPWDSQISNLGMLAIDPQGNESPGALRVTLPPQPIGPGPTLTTSLGAPTTETRLRFDLQIDAFDPTREVDLLQLRWEPPPPCTAYGLYIVKTTEDVLALQETYVDCGGVKYHTIGSLDVDWHRYEVVVNHVESRVTVLRDGASVASSRTTQPFPAAPQDLYLGAPLVVSGIVATWLYRFDNVVIEHD